MPRRKKNRSPPDDLVSLAQNRRVPEKTKAPARRQTKKKKFVSMFDDEPEEVEKVARMLEEDDDLDADLDLDSDSDAVVVAHVPATMKKSARTAENSDEDSDAEVVAHVPLTLKKAAKKPKVSPKRGKTSKSVKPAQAFKAKKPSKVPSPSGGTSGRTSDSTSGARARAAPASASPAPERTSKRIKRRREEDKVACYKDLNSGKGWDDELEEVSPSARKSRLKKSSKRPGKTGTDGAPKSSQAGSSAQAKLNTSPQEDEVLDDEAFMASQESVSSIKLSIKPIKARKRRRPSEEKQAEYARARKTLTDDERGLVRQAFYGLYPAPPSNLRAQSNFEQKYGTQMSQAMSMKLWKYEFEQWSKRWWDFYNQFVEVARAKKLGKRKDQDPSLTKSECVGWAREFHAKWGDAKPERSLGELKREEMRARKEAEAKKGDREVVEVDAGDDGHGATANAAGFLGNVEEAGAAEHDGVSPDDGGSTPLTSFAIGDEVAPGGYTPVTSFAIGNEVVPVPGAVNGVVEDEPAVYPAGHYVQYGAPADEQGYPSGEMLPVSSWTQRS